MDNIETTEKVLHIRHAENVPVKTVENTIEIAGVLTAPYDFLSKKMNHKIKRTEIFLDGFQETPETTYDLEQSTVYIHSEKGELLLKLNEKRVWCDEIKGSLTKHEVWGFFKVNTGDFFSPDELRKAMKRSRFYFKDKSQLEDSLHKLFDFRAKVETQITDKNKSGDFEIGRASKVVEMQVPTTFNLEAPVYEGYEKHVINIEVVADVSSGSVRFTLESPDLFQLEQELKEQYIKAELSRLRGLSDKLSFVTLG